jgi:hypothetical protein
LESLLSGVRVETEKFLSTNQIEIITFEPEDGEIESNEDDVPEDSEEEKISVSGEDGSENEEEETPEESDEEKEK